MLGILGNLKLIVGVVLGVVLFGAGYGLGARKVHALEEQIARIKGAGDEAKDTTTKTKGEIEKMLEAKEAEFKQRSQELQADAEKRAQELSTALAGANGRIATLQGQAGTVDTKRSKLVAELTKASAAEKQELQKQIEALDREKKGLLAKVASNQCLALAVPDEAIAPLIR
jgi:chromosome segregation ATPase